MVHASWLVFAFFAGVIFEALCAVRERKTPEGGEKCQCCGKFYATIYRVPNDVWAKIAPDPETLGPYREHQFGGLLCITCADQRARELGILLYWDSSSGDWK